MLTISEVYDEDADTRVLYFDGEKVKNAKAGNEELAVNECCSLTFTRTPIINNEMVNRSVIGTAQTRKARLNIIQALLSHSDTPDFYEGSNQEANKIRTDDMIYLDNAATTFPKPEEVYVAMDKVNREEAVNAGRGSYKLAQKASKLISETKGLIRKLVGADSNAAVIFSPSITIAINQIIYGLQLREKAVVYISPFEHNAVARSIYQLSKKKSITIKELPINENLEIDMERVKYEFSKDKPEVVICIHVSNVTGYVLPVDEIFEEAKKHGSITVLDSAQSLGLIECQANYLKADIIAFAGHKTLYGPFGIGGFINVTGIPLDVFISGGTGSNSLDLNMPRRLYMSSYIDYMAGLSQSDLRGYLGQDMVDLLIEWLPNGDTLLTKQRMVSMINSLYGTSILKEKNFRRDILQCMKPAEIMAMRDACLTGSEKLETDPLAVIEIVASKPWSKNAVSAYLLKLWDVPESVFDKETNMFGNKLIHIDSDILNQINYGKLKALADGSAVITPAFNMTNAKAVIHAVGPNFSVTPKAFKELFDAYYNSLKVLMDNGYHSISFPLISSGIFGGSLANPVAESTKQCCRAYKKFVDDYPEYEIDVLLCAFMPAEMTEAQAEFNNYF